MSLTHHLFAAVGEPMFGSTWIAVTVILVGVAVFIGLVAVVGRILAAGHPDGEKKQKKAAPAAAAASAATQNGPSNEVLAVIAATIATIMDGNARIVGITSTTPQAPSVEALMQTWSLEGRRQIYTSHNPR